MANCSSVHQRYCLNRTCRNALGAGTAPRPVEHRWLEGLFLIDGTNRANLQDRTSPLGALIGTAEFGIKQRLGHPPSLPRASSLSGCRSRPPTPPAPLS